ncbi:MAG: flagellar biosynthesis protein FlhA [Acidobacteriota bacterium]
MRSSATGLAISQFETPKRLDLAVGLAVLTIIGVMLVPVPPFVLDFLIAINVTASVILLLISLYVTEPIAFSVFPTVLLLMTLYRLSLNVASTRLILLEGGSGTSAAGRVIESFGQFVVGGNYVVGAVVFLVLIAIQYIVVNHGAVRTSEVTARFTLDAMPGKQMSIDADLNAGLIDEEQARERRKRVSQEAEFYGSMDGAVRFTQRDAVASIIIVAINIIAGFLIGVVSHGMPLMEAMKTYTILTIGDGLVTAIPALLVSVTAGIMTTRAASESDLGEEVSTQMFSDPKPMAIGAAVLMLIAVIPGLPFLSFFLLGASTGAVTWYMSRRRKTAAQIVRNEAIAETRPPEEKMETLLRVDPLGLELGYQLIHLVENKPGTDFLSHIKSIRRQLASELGVIVPPIHITDNLQLKPKEYRILLKGVDLVHGELNPGFLMAIDPGQVTKAVEGIPAREPAFQLDAVWIRPEDREKAQLAGYTVVENTTVLATHLTETIKGVMHELLSRQEVKGLIDAVNETHPKVVEELIPSVMRIGEVQKVLQNLLRERVSIRDMVTILETLADFAPRTKNTALLTEYTRQALGRSICRPFIDEEGTLRVLTLAHDLERLFADSITVTEADNFLTLAPAHAKNFIVKLQKALSEKPFDGYPILLVTSNIRLHVRRLVEDVISNLVVLSHNEIPPHVKLISLGEVSL